MSPRTEQEGIKALYCGHTKLIIYCEDIEKNANKLICRGNDAVTSEEKFSELTETYLPFEGSDSDEKNTQSIFEELLSRNEFNEISIEIKEHH